jgi:imidazolonepropionase-like amidohydrolase
MDAILSATAYGGEIMLHPHELGKVVPGAYADLILVNGNPLDDISLLSHKDNIDVIVMVRCAFCWDFSCPEALIFLSL